MDFSTQRAQLIPNSAEYQRVHRWVVKHAGKAVKCVAGCDSSRYHWSNISKSYQYNLSDWEQVCPKCHKKRDKLTEEGRKSISEKNRINSQGNQSHAKPVVMIDSTGKRKRFSSAIIASKETGVIRTAISNVLTGRAKTAGGYEWRRA